VSDTVKRFTRLYGSNRLHALLLLGCFAFVGYVASRVLQVSHPGWIAIWLAGAIIAHDLVLFPAYTAIDRLLSDRHRRPPSSTTGVSWKNHVRVPAVICGILLLITFPLVLRLSNATYVEATGLNTSVYLGRWLLVSVCVFGASGLVYGLRLLARRGPTASSRHGEHMDTTEND
jgi:hypothetical protein